MLDSARGEDAPVDDAMRANLAAGMGRREDGRDPATWGRLEHLTDPQAQVLSLMTERLERESSPSTFWETLPTNDPFLVRFRNEEAHEHDNTSSMNPPPTAAQPNNTTSSPQSITDQRSAFLLRFLRARDFDIDAAVTLLRSMLEWRATTQPWTIPQDAKTHPEASLHIYHTGAYDSQGHPVLYAASANMRRTVAVKERFRDASIRLLEDMYMNMPDGQDQFVIVYDYEGFSALTNFSISIVRSMLFVLQECYPESMSATYFLPNYSSSFYAVWKIVRPFIHPFTASKIHFLQTTSYREHLMEKIGAEALVPWLGGSYKGFVLPGPAGDARKQDA